MVDRSMTDLVAAMRLGGPAALEWCQNARRCYLASGYHIGDTAKLLGVSRRTLEKARRNYPNLDQAFDPLARDEG